MKAQTITLLTALLSASPALAAGALVEGDGSFLSGPTEEADIANVRALLFRQGDEVTTVVQSAVNVGQVIGSAWILPVHGDILMEPVTTSPTILDELLRVSDPIYEVSGDGCGGGCATTVGDTGMLANVRFFDETKASANWTRFGPSAVDAAVTSLQTSGFAVSDELASDMRNFGSSGGSFVVVWFTGDSTGSASPAVAVRYTSNQLILPQALTRHSSADEVQTVVITMSDTPTSPSDAEWTTPVLGLPLYPSEHTPKFYESRVRVAIDNAGGDAWVLEYSNTLDTLESRRALLDNEEEVLWDASSSVPWSGLRALKNKDVLDEFQPEEVWFTRWRTIRSSELLDDQAFDSDESVPRYEVYVPSEEYGAAAWIWAAPFALVGWAWRRRRRQERLG